MGGPNGQIVCIKRAADKRRQKSREIIDEKREKYRARSGFERSDFCDFDKHPASAPIRMERLSPRSKASGEARNKFVEKGGVPDRVKSFTEIDSRENRPRVERLSHLMDGNNGRCFRDGRKGIQRPGKIKNVKKKIHARARKVP